MNHYYVYACGAVWIVLGPEICDVSSDDKIIEHLLACDSKKFNIFQDFQLNQLLFYEVSNYNITILFTNSIIHNLPNYRPCANTHFNIIDSDFLQFLLPIIAFYTWISCFVLFLNTSVVYFYVIQRMFFFLYIFAVIQPLPANVEINKTPLLTCCCYYYYYYYY